jgi:hypothetical protein
MWGAEVRGTGSGVSAVRESQTQPRATRSTTNWNPRVLEGGNCNVHDSHLLSTSNEVFVKRADRQTRRDLRIEVRGETDFSESSLAALSLLLAGGFFHRLIDLPSAPSSRCAPARVVFRASLAAPYPRSTEGLDCDTRAVGT